MNHIKILGGVIWKEKLNHVHNSSKISSELKITMCLMTVHDRNHHEGKITKQRETKSTILCQCNYDKNRLHWNLSVANNFFIIQR